MPRTCLDRAATTPTRPDVLQAMLPYCTGAFGNPACIQSCGQDAKGAVGEGSVKVAESIGARCEESIFAGARTDADSCAVKAGPTTAQTIGTRAEY
jgi:cysteine desulfurase